MELVEMGPLNTTVSTSKKYSFRAEKGPKETESMELERIINGKNNKNNKSNITPSVPIMENQEVSVQNDGNNLKKPTMNMWSVSAPPISPSSTTMTQIASIPNAIITQKNVANSSEIININETPKQSL